MTIKVKRVGLPPELEAIVSAYASAIVAGDDRLAATFVEERATASLSAAMEHIASMRPLKGVEVIARARLGFQYIVKLRFRSGAGSGLVFQTRWHRGSVGVWRLIEIEDSGSQSPWKKAGGAAR
jgi:hypothetical protein